MDTPPKRKKGRPTKGVKDHSFNLTPWHDALLNACRRPEQSRSAAVQRAICLLAQDRGIDPNTFTAPENASGARPDAERPKDYFPP